MRFFKRREEPDVEVQRTRSYAGGRPDPRTNEVAITSNTTRAMTQQRHSLSSNHLYNSHNKKSIGDLAKKLNCAGAKVRDEEEMLAAGEHSILLGVGKGMQIPGMHLPGMKRSSSWGGAFPESAFPCLPLAESNARLQPTFLLRL